MHATELAELAGVIATNSRVILDTQSRLSDSGVHAYWANAKKRFEQWSKNLVAFRKDASNAIPSEAQWRSVAPIFEEIFISDILTRVWSALACEHDRRHGTSYVSPVVRSIMIGHLEARGRALGVLFHHSDEDNDEVRRLNSIRRQSERWTDMLLAYFVPFNEIGSWAYEPKRVLDFAEDVADQSAKDVVDQSWRLLQASLKNAFQKSVSGTSANAELNEQISASILSCFRPDLVQATGMLRTLWMVRMTHTATDTQAMLEELLAT